MHIILGVLGALVTILILANRLQENGIDVGWLNPFSWARRRKFRKEYQMHPAYTLESPLDVAALFMVAVAKADGDITRAQKDKIFELFQSELKLSEKQATDLFGSSVHIFGRGDDVLDNPSRVLARTAESFTDEQVHSVLSMLDIIASVDGSPSEAQIKLIKKITKAIPIKD
ncbi:TerB family tellurite resistance protein [Glaciecola sp. MH2013]|uniref:tellurite resistance TerB family protein n=1 Tax=Glaciecola sp. MH2013 TaxID=2785524 RepID=UPI0018A0F821|nr:TerB family tellurite resistance protein [Glaciecola sp. MH2013]MBF7073400.1 TerB family tellurite resistance protein [Glaciecola sp. MH2013]